MRKLLVLCLYFLVRSFFYCPILFSDIVRKDTGRSPILQTSLLAMALK